MSSLGLYVHLPFCSRRCPYCGFAVVTGQDHLQERYAAAVAAEIHLRHRGEGPFDTVFFGGGTPSRMPVALVERILHAARASYGIAKDAEVTIEANPASADARAFEGLRRVGCNRLSLGLQAFDDATLKALGRAHTAAEGARAFAAARGTGFDKLSMDLIFSVPGAPAHEWERTLAKAVSLAPDHISTYALTIEENTPFQRRRECGELVAVEEEQDADAFLAAQRLLGAAGYEQYEVSNFAQPGARCRHNWSCWMGEDYVGVGLSAHGSSAGRRAWNTADMRGYLEAVESGQVPEEGRETLGAHGHARELAWLRLRTCTGIGLDAEKCQRLQTNRHVAELTATGLAMFEDGRLWLTGSGLAVADAAAELVCDALGLDVAMDQPAGGIEAVA